MPEGDPTPQDQPKDEPKAPPAGKFTQEDVDRINAETRRKAEDASTKRLLEALGIEDLDKGKEIIKAARAAEESAKSEIQRAMEENERLKAIAEQATTKARHTLVQSRVETALRDAGLNPKRLAGALRLAPLGDVQVADDGSVAGVEDVVKAVQESSPEWFGAPGAAFSAPEASSGATSTEFNWATATAEERNAQLTKYGVTNRPARKH